MSMYGEDFVVRINGVQSKIKLFNTEWYGVVWSRTLQARNRGSSTVTLALCCYSTLFLNKSEHTTFSHHTT